MGIIPPIWLLLGLNKMTWMCVKHSNHNKECILCFKYIIPIIILPATLLLSTSPAWFLLTFNKNWAPTTSQTTMLPPWSPLRAASPESFPLSNSLTPTILVLTIHFGTYSYKFCINTSHVFLTHKTNHREGWKTGSYFFDIITLNVTLHKKSN